MLELELYCCFFSRFVVHQIMLQCVFFFSAVCRVPNRAPVRVFFFAACRLVHEIVLQRTKSCSTVCFFSRLVVHQIVLQCTKSCFNACFFFSRFCRAPNHAPMRFFFSPGLSCTKSCCMVSIMLKVRALVIILFVL